MSTDVRLGVDPIITEARERWQRCDEAETRQRERILLAKNFRAGKQWDDAIEAARKGVNALQGVAAQPPRPCLVIDRLSQPCRQVSNQIKTANFAIDVVPNGHGADDDTAEIIKGYLRRVQNQARGESPIEWAADGAIEGGLGWFRIRTEFVDESPETDGPEVFDQELRLERITNNLTVYCDPAANRPTRSDAQYMFVTEDLAKEEVVRRWPQADLRSLEDFTAIGDPIAGKWVTKDLVRIAEYWTITYTDEKWAALRDGSIRRVETFPKDAKATRTVRKPTVKCYKINAVEILEEWEWLGSRIPLIPVIGEELNVDGTILLRGMVSEGMDAQRMVNYTYSGAMEIYALGPKSPWIMPAESVAAYQAIWQTANTYNYAYLPYDPFDAQGRPLPNPQETERQAPIQASVELMRVSEEAIKATTGWYDSGLGAHDRRTLSGRAKQSEIQQSELGSSNYGDGVSRALVYAGELMVEVLPKITRPGQILHILGQDDEPQQIMAGQQFVKGPDGRPQPDADPQKLQEGVAQFYDLTKGRYAVTVVVGKANATKREEGAAALGELIPHLPPEMAAVATPDYVEQLSFPGAHKIAEKLRKALPPGLRDEEEGEADPEKIALQQQVQQLQQALQGKLAEEQAKQQATLQKTQIEEAAESQRAQQDAQIQIAKAEIAANAQIAVAEIKAGSEDLERRLKLIEIYLTSQQEARLELEAKHHEHIQGAHERAHDVGLTAMEQRHEKELAQMGHEQAIEQTTHAAALEPSPNGEGE